MTQVLSEIQKEYGPKGVQVLESAFNDGAENLVLEFVERFKPAFPVGYNNRDAVLGFLERSVLDLPRLYVPQMAFIDRGSTIRAVYRGEDAFFKDAARNIRAEIDKLMLQPSLPVRKKR